MKRDSRSTTIARGAFTSPRKFGALLRKERAEVLALLAAQQVTEPESGGFGHNHPAEAAGGLYDHEEALSMKRLLHQRLAEVDAALQRIRDGSYGWCEVCGQSIARARLEAIPMARRRVECQERLERAPVSRHGLRGR